jgi:hypothetical protein
MSGGHFDYDQYRITTIADSIESVIEKNKKPIDPKDKDNYWGNQEFYYDFPDEVIEEFKRGVELLKKAQIYAHRIDWLLSGDDGDETFIRRLNDDLKKLDNG